MLFRKIIRHITPLNLLLLGIIAALAFYAYGTFYNFEVSFASLKPKAPAETQETKSEAAPSPSSAEYSVIADSNLFHPERIIPPEKKADQLPKPEFVLSGTLITHDTQIAYLEDLKAPHSTAGRGQRQRALKLGQTLSGYTIKEIHHDRVLMAKHDEMIEVKIGTKKRARTGDAASTAAVPPQTQTAQPSPAATPPASPKAGGQPPGVVHAGPPPPGTPVPDEKTISGVRDAIAPGIMKRSGIQQQR